MIRAVLVVILLLLIAWAFWRMVDAVIEALGGKPERKRRTPSMKLARDPVCGTWVQPSDALSVRAGSTTYYFCSERCRDSYRKSA